jgi:hypothetical protein
MWYQRLLAWVRSIFAPSKAAATYPSNNSPYSPTVARTPTLPLTAPLRDPRLLDSMPPPIEFPPRREPPTTAPLARIAHPSQPLQGIPPAADGLGARQALWSARDNPQPSQPIQPPPIHPAPPSQPLSIDFARMERVEPDPDEFGENAGDDLSDDEITPGSMLYRRLMILRRLVRQGVYNEGFTPDATPDQYRRYADPDGFDTPFYGE